RNGSKTPVVAIAIAAAAVVVIAVVAFFALAGNQSAQSPESTQAASSSVSTTSSASAASSSSASGGTASSGSASASASSSAAFDTWAAECTDKWNTPTGYAISELKGWQLETLLQQLGYRWNSSQSAWADGSTSLYVMDKNTQPLDDDEIAALDKGGAGTPVLFRIVTANYPAVKSAYSGLIGDVMVSEDSEFLDNMGFGIAYGPSMKRFLVYVTEQGSDIELYLFNEDAVAAGMFDRITGDSYGSTVKEAFNNVVGRG
ncbi:MAG: hypothetical protein IJ087_09445, partial [Eggerthellaceae bacterium]|nr:hypothetical protein [Eggerthellaceae bacterium]